jgi:predicted Rossmann fold nucleotide-binding protein DprA/Smf involved in DNA uptake
MIENGINSIGNKDILKEYKIGFLCSRKVPSDIILKTYDWAIEQREKGVCVVSGFHSKIEKDVFHYLLKGTQPIIMVLARSMYKKVPDLLKTEVDKGRLLIISPFGENVKRASEKTTYLRNKYIIEISDEMYIPFVKEREEIFLNGINKQ